MIDYLPILLLAAGLLFGINMLAIPLGLPVPFIGIIAWICFPMLCLAALLILGYMLFANRQSSSTDYSELRGRWFPWAHCGIASGALMLLALQAAFALLLPLVASVEYHGTVLIYWYVLLVASALAFFALFMFIKSS